MHFTMERAGGITPAVKEAIKAFFPKEYGALPPSMKELTPGEWAWGNSSYSPSAELYIGDVQMDGERWTLKASAYHGGYHNHGGGFVVAFKYGYPAEHLKARFFSWASCDHTYSSKNIGRCLNRYTCTQCQHFYDVDSSD